MSIGSHRRQPCGERERGSKRESERIEFVKGKWSTAEISGEV